MIGLWKRLLYRSIFSVCLRITNMTFEFLSTTFCSRKSKLNSLFLCCKTLNHSRLYILCSKFILKLWGTWFSSRLDSSMKMLLSSEMIFAWEGMMIHDQRVVSSTEVTLLQVHNIIESVGCRNTMINIRALSPRIVEN